MVLNLKDQLNQRIVQNICTDGLSDMEGKRLTRDTALIAWRAELSAEAHVVDLRYVMIPLKQGHSSSLQVFVAPYGN